MASCPGFTNRSKLRAGLQRYRKTVAVRLLAGAKNLTPEFGCSSPVSHLYNCALFLPTPFSRFPRSLLYNTNHCQVSENSPQLPSPSARLPPFPQLPQIESPAPHSRCIKLTATSLTLSSSPPSPSEKATRTRSVTRSPMPSSTPASPRIPPPKWHASRPPRRA